MAALERSFSRQRLQAYRLPEDRDERDGIARYAWNLALAAALQPALHTLEIAFRNEMARAAAKLTAGRVVSYDRIGSWLDARPTMLLPHEAGKVERSKAQLGTDPRSQTEGHLIAKLDFGFWVALCRAAYDDARAAGPRLWPRALGIAFQRRPASVSTRGDIHQRFDRIREFRNRVAHHEPIWDRGYLEQHELVIDSIGWMSPKLADATATLSPAPALYRSGLSAYRSLADRLLGAETNDDTRAPADAPSRGPALLDRFAAD
jgi:hypothetical protein